MTKKFAIVLALFVISIVCCAGCIGPGDNEDPEIPDVPDVPDVPVTPVDPVDPVVPVEEYSVMFMLNYGDAGAYTAETVKAGETVSKPATPTRSGYTFKGWFTAAEGGVEYDFTQAVNADVTLYAQWKKKSSSGGSSHSHSYTATVTEPTCTTDGYTTYTCSCGHSYTGNTVPMLGHSQFITKANESETGAIDTICGVCNAVLFTTSATGVLEIYTVDDLKNFAATVNAGETYSGKTVKLMADLDLNNEEWTPIGTAENNFTGTFEGTNKVISNLKITGSEYVGLFGYIDGYVKNLSVNHAVISGNHWVGTIVGYGLGGEISGCSVSDATITVEPNGVSGDYDNGDKAGGIVGYGGYGDGSSIGHLKVTDCTVSNVKITAYRDVGGIVGAAWVDGVTGNSASDVTVTVDKVKNSYNDAGVNGNPILGRAFGTGTLADQTATNWKVTIIYTDGFQSVQTATESWYEISNANGLRYFADQFSANFADFKDKEIKLMDDINLEGESWTPINSWHSGCVTLNGNGKTISNMEINNNGGKAGFIGSNNVNWLIKDLTFKGANVVTDHSWTGIVIGYQYGNVVMQNVSVVDSTLSSTSTADYGISLGPLVGYSVQNDGAKLTLEKCTVTRVTVTGYHSLGGLIGITKKTQCSDSFKVTDCKVEDSTINYAATGGIGGHYWAAGDGGYDDAIFDGTGNTLKNVNIIGPLGLKETGEDGKSIITTSETVTLDKLASLTASAGLGDTIVLGADVEGDATITAPYGNKYAVALNGGTLDGNNHELHMECYGDDYGIMTTGGTVKNIIIEEGCRAVMIMCPTEDVILDNVNIGGDGVLYPINTGEAGSEGVNLIVTNSVIAGWTSYSNIESASFTNVEFKQGTYYNNIYGRVLKPYVNTELNGCSFIEHMNLDLSALTAGHKVTIKDCTVDGQDVTADVFTVPTSDEAYDTELFTVDLPSWASSIDDCIVFE